MRMTRNIRETEKHDTTKAMLMKLIRVVFQFGLRLVHNSRMARKIGNIVKYNNY